MNVLLAFMTQTENPRPGAAFNDVTETGRD